MSQNLLIGVSSCFMYPDPQRSTFSKKSLSYIENDMARYLTTGRSLPILLPDLEKQDLLRLCSQMDGFVLQGGVDVAPQTYEEEPLDSDRWPGDAFRDEYELFILDYAYSNRKPVLAICRGCQIANCYFGGTLYQDLETQIKSTIEHRNSVEYDKISHDVGFEETGYLKGLYSTRGPIRINSVHHQGIKRLGTDLVVEARSPEDGLIEAYRYKNLDEFYLIGVQWHPEFSHTLGDGVISPQPLLEDFLNRCATLKGK